MDVINELFEVRRKPNGQRYSDSEIARRCEDYLQRNNGGTCSRTYIGKLRKGSSDNPTLQQLNALAYAFELNDPGVFHDQTLLDQVAAEQTMLTALRNLVESQGHTALFTVLLRMTECTDEQIGHLAELAKQYAAENVHAAAPLAAASSAGSP